MELYVYDKPKLKMHSSKTSEMKISSQPLSDFINDLDLNIPDKGICFNATINFSSKFLTLNLNSEVHIIHIDVKNMNVIYLLSSDIPKSSMPDMFEDHHDEFTYLFKDCLIVKGASLSFGKYVLIIRPSGSNCSEETLAKLHLQPFTFN